MGESKQATATYNDVSTVYEQYNDFLDDTKWQVPTYKWSIEQTQTLNAMPLKTLETHLRPLLGARVSIEKLHDSYSNRGKKILKNYNNSIDELNSRFAEYKNKNCHPHEINYRNNHDGKLPMSQPIDYWSKRSSVIGMIISVIIIVTGFFIMDSLYGDSLFNAIVAVILLFTMALGLLVGTISVLTFICSRHGWKISHPLESFANSRRVAHKKRILNKDKLHCKIHDCSDENLKKKYKYYEALEPIYGDYVSRMKIEYINTNNKLKNYYQFVWDNVANFPPEQTQNTYHLLRIYGALLNGMPTWYQAYEHVSQDERFENMTLAITQAINEATVAVRREVREARDEINNELSRANDTLREIKNETEKQTEEIQYWSQVQTTIAAEQTAIMASTNAYVRNISNR